MVEDEHEVSRYEATRRPWPAERVSDPDRDGQEQVTSDSPAAVLYVGRTRFAVCQRLDEMIERKNAIERRGPPPCARTFKLQRQAGLGALD